MVPVIGWLLALWDAIAGERPPFCPAVLLADHSPTWQAPQRELRQLWTVLRLCTLHAIWSTRTAAAIGGTQPPPASTVVAVAVARIRRLIMLDYTRVLHDVRCLTGASSAWFAGRDPRLAMDKFWARWGQGGVLCTLVDGRLVVKLSVSFPVPGVVDIHEANR